MAGRESTVYRIARLLIKRIPDDADPQVQAELLEQRAQALEALGAEDARFGPETEALAYQARMQARRLRGHR
jgi:hypothetical protein